MTPDRLWRWHLSSSIPGREECLPSAILLLCITSLSFCCPENSVGARKNGQEHVPLPETKFCQLYVVDHHYSHQQLESQLTLLLCRVVVCKWSVCPVSSWVCTSLKAHCRQSSDLPGTYKQRSVFYKALSVTSGGNQTTPKVSSACLRFKLPNCWILHW